MRLRHLAAAVCACSAAAANATDVNVIGLFPGKAVVVIDRGAPRTLAAGQKTPEGVMLISSDSKQAVLEIDGKRETLEMGQDYTGASRQSAERPSVTLPADSRGQFYVDGQVNGVHERFVVDTGATTVLLPGPDADRMAIDYKSKGQQGHIQTANGTATAYRVVLDSVTIGGITAYNVEAVVAEGSGLDVALLGMSFLNRTEMRRDGAYMTLTKRY